MRFLCSYSFLRLFGYSCRANSVIGMHAQKNAAPLAFQSEVFGVTYQENELKARADARAFSLYSS